MAELWPLHGGEHEFKNVVIRLFGEIQEALAAIQAAQAADSKKLEQVIMSQSDIDAATAELTAIVTDVQGQVAQLGTDFTAIQAEITSLQAQGVNTTALNAAVAQAQSTMAGLDPAVAQIGTLAPAPAAPAAPSEPSAS